MSSGSQGHDLFGNTFIEAWKGVSFGSQDDVFSRRIVSWIWIKKETYAV